MKLLKLLKSHWWGIISMIVALISFFTLSLITWQHGLEPHPLGLKISGEKKTVLITHGGLANKETMFAYAYAKADLGYTVILADLPAHGSSRLLMADVNKKTSLKEWKEGTDEEYVIEAIGHSLGSAFLCPQQPTHVIFPSTIHIGGLCTGKRRTNFQGSFFESMIGTDHLFLKHLFYGIDHIFEPWNPWLITEVTGNRDLRRIIGYSLLPWVLLVFGLLAVIAAQREISWVFEEKYNKPYFFGTISAVFLIGAFVLLTLKSLWYSLPSHSSDLFLGLLIAIPCLGLNFLLSRFAQGRSNHIITIGLNTSWIFVVSLLVVNNWNGWPDYLLQRHYPPLIIGASAGVFLILQMCRFQNVASKNTCFVYIMTYLSFILLPSTNFSDLIERIFVATSSLIFIQ